MRGLAWLLLLVLAGCVHGNWFMDLLNPSISSWDPISAQAELEQTKVGFSTFQGYVSAFGDFNADK